MSIIYDALKKIEDKVPVPGAAPAGRTNHATLTPIKLWLLSAAVLAAGFLLAQLVFSSSYVKNFVRNSTGLPPDPAPTPIPASVLAAGPQTQVQPSLPTPHAATPQQAAAPKPAPAWAKTKKAYTLNGIFTADNVCYALINNSIVQEGEMIGAAMVVSITTDSVELEENGQPIKLTTKKF